MWGDGITVRCWYDGPEEHASVIFEGDAAPADDIRLLVFAIKELSDLVAIKLQEREERRS